MQFLLRHSIVMAVLALTVPLIPMLALATERTDTKKIISPAIQGTLIKIEEGVFTVKSTTGQTKRVRIDFDTKMAGIYREGEYIQAWLLPDGRAESIVSFKDTKQN
jgi:hypothetical protein